MRTIMERPKTMYLFLNFKSLYSVQNKRQLTQRNMGKPSKCGIYTVVCTAWNTRADGDF